MIGKLTGVIDSISDDHCIIDVAGVGYAVHCPTRILFTMKVGEARSIITHLLVKEDQLTLFGFESFDEKTCFLNLQIVQGVGAKMALSILNNLDPAQITNAIIAEDTSAFRQISGIGPKLAGRIVNELKSRKDIFISSHLTANSPINQPNNTSSPKAVVHDVMSALANLGFSRSDAFPIVQQLYVANENTSFDELVKNSLNKLSTH
jgi:Holliday junction DNA helicase RuvA